MEGTIVFGLYPAVETSAHSSVSHIVQDVEVNKQTHENDTAGQRDSSVIIVVNNDFWLYLEAILHTLVFIL